jgi:hypothetical protein
MRNKNITKKWVASLLFGATGLLTSNLHAIGARSYSGSNRVADLAKYYDQPMEEREKQKQLQRKLEQVGATGLLTSNLHATGTRSYSGSNRVADLAEYYDQTVEEREEQKQLQRRLEQVEFEIRKREMPSPIEWFDKCKEEDYNYKQKGLGEAEIWQKIHYAQTSNLHASEHLTLQQQNAKNLMESWFTLSTYGTGSLKAIFENAIQIHGGVDYTYQNEDGNTVLHRAATNGDKPVVTLLINKGAPLNIKNKAGKTPLEEAEKEFNLMKEEVEKELNPITKCKLLHLEEQWLPQYEEVISILKNAMAKQQPNSSYLQSLYSGQPNDHQPLPSYSAQPNSSYLQSSYSGQPNDYRPLPSYSVQQDSSYLQSSYSRQLNETDHRRTQ